MIELITAVSLFCLFVPAYVYAGYPLILVVLDKIVRGKKVDTACIFPTVTMIVSCYNEAEIIEEKIVNGLEIDYPTEKLNFIFVSDGSDDGTDDLISRHSSKRAKLLRQEGRLGKTMGLNMAVPQADSEIIIFSDANAMYATNAVRMLVRNFNDDDVGYVVGAALYRDEVSSSAGQSENAYWQYEMFLKRIESKLHSVVGGDGAIYAIRKHLYTTLDREDINDLVNPLQIIRKGFRGVFEPEAVCYEQTAGDFDKEAERKQRIVNRSFTAVRKNKALLNPIQYGFFAFELWSHKVLRWLSPFFIVMAGIGVVILAQAKIVLFELCLLLGIVVVWSIVIGSLLKRSRTNYPIFLYPYYFYLVNINSALGVLQSLRGKVKITWRTAREAEDRGITKKTGSAIASLALLISAAWLFAETLRSVLGAYGYD